MKAIVVEDSIYTREIIKRILTNNGFEVVAETSMGEKAIDLAIHHQPDFIFLDYMLPDISGSEVIERLNEEEIETRIVVVSAITDEAIKQELKELGAFAFLEKKFTNPEEFSDQLKRFLDTLV